MSTFDIGDQPTLVVTFKGNDGVLADPTNIDFEVLRPSDAEGTPSVTGTEVNATNPSTGVWQYVLPQLDEEGHWEVRATGTAGVVASVTQRFVVRATRFD